MSDFAGACRFFEQPQGMSQNGKLTVTIADLPHGTSKRKFDGGRSGDADGVVKFGHGGKHHRGDAVLFQQPRRQSNGPATERSGRCEQRGVDRFLLHSVDHGLYAGFQEIVAGPLKPVE